MNLSSNPEPRGHNPSNSPTGGDSAFGGDFGALQILWRDGFLIWHSALLRLMIGWSGVVLAMALMVGGWWLSRRPGDSDLPALALLAILMAAAGSTFQGAAHLILCCLHRAVPRVLVLTAVGFRVRPDGFLGRWLQHGLQDEADAKEFAIQRLIELAFPSLLLLLIAAIARSGVWLWTGETNPLSDPEGDARLALVLNSPPYIAAWTWLLQSTWSLLPVPGSHGRAVMEAITVLTAREITPSALVRRTNMIQSLLAITVVSVGVWLWSVEPATNSIPAWPFVIALGMLVWSGRRSISDWYSSHRHVASEQIDGPISVRRRKSAGLTFVGRRRVKRAQRTELAEALDEAQLDTVLGKLHASGPGSLSSAERTLLRRVSRRLRDSKDRGAGADNRKKD